jgi:thymidylate synthase ThyX
LKITNFEHTGLDRVEAWLLTRNRQTVGLADLRECLKTINVSFALEGINRVQSMLICELKDSYVQQSQRYVAYRNQAFDVPELPVEEREKAQTLIRQAFDLYQAMCEADIPMEDARYVLPLSARTNLSVAMSADKLMDWFALCDDGRYRRLMQPIRRALEQRLSAELLRWFKMMPPSETSGQATYMFYREAMARLTPVQPVILFQAFEHLDIKAGLGAVTSTLANPPSATLEMWGPEALSKARGVASRVLGYGHKSIAEQARTTFGMMCSLAAYHQQIRHRLSSNHREDFSVLMLDVKRPVVIPPHIQASVFRQDFLRLIKAFRLFRQQILERFGVDQAMLVLQNCDQIKMIYSTNARMDAEMLAERVCMNAQWEIRELSIRKLHILRGLSETLYERAVPSCVYGHCKEGLKSCGLQSQMRAEFGPAEGERDIRSGINE